MQQTWDPSALVEPITLRQLTIPNRLWMAAMCQYSAAPEGPEQGAPNDWHFQHLAARAVGGTGLIVTEATAVSPEGRISPYDLGLWNDTQVAAFRRITDFVKAQGATVGIQIAHASCIDSQDASRYFHARCLSSQRALSEQLLTRERCDLSASMQRSKRQLGPNRGESRRRALSQPHSQFRQHRQPRRPAGRSGRSRAPGVLRGHPDPPRRPRRLRSGRLSPLP
ncbi:hypothetical protein [Streptomyces sp. NPDC053542]|uniref:oxidoreductase n=1 Tax=Streptomyces sp. NPDC053542 TaxID=3365710 RepID=UPI0037CF69F1